MANSSIEIVLVGTADPDNLRSDWDSQHRRLLKTVTAERWRTPPSIPNH